MVHGEDGLDEVSTTAPTWVFEIQTGQVTKRQLTPEDFHLPRTPTKSLKGGDIAANCRIAESILHGEKGPQRDVVLANAALALYAAHQSSTLPGCVKVAEISLDSGNALAVLKALAAGKPN